MVEDVITTGGSVRRLLKWFAAWAAKWGAGVLVDRSGGTAKLGVRTEALLTTKAASYAPEDCPLCKRGIPAVKPGSRNV